MPVYNMHIDQDLDKDLQEERIVTGRDYIQEVIRDIVKRYFKEKV